MYMHAYMHMIVYTSGSSYQDIRYCDVFLQSSAADV